MDEKGDEKISWFRPKRSGLGITPITWQGWLITLLGAATEIGTITFAHDTHASWFKAKTQGSGFTPATWDGWLATVGPIALFLFIILSIYFRQRKD